MMIENIITNLYFIFFNFITARSISVRFALDIVGFADTQITNYKLIWGLNFNCGHVIIIIKRIKGDTYG